LIVRRLDTDADRVVGRTGIKTRYFAPAGIASSGCFCRWPAPSPQLNTTAAPRPPRPSWRKTLPCWLDAAVPAGRVQHAHRLLLEGNGGGFTWSAALLLFWKTCAVSPPCRHTKSTSRTLLIRRRVVINGLGILSSVGNTGQQAWDNTVVGRFGVGPISRFDGFKRAVGFAGKVKDVDVSTYLPARQARRMDSVIPYGMASAIQAIKDAGLQAHPSDVERIGVSNGSGIGGLPLIDATHDDCLAAGARKISPFFVPGSLINRRSGKLSILYGLKGPNVARALSGAQR
jgi:hypothetical protein